MAIEADVIYRNRDQIVADFISRFQTRIPDLHVEEDGNLRMFGEVLAEIVEGVYLANQIQRDNIFVPSANLVELRRHGEQFGLTVKQGTKSVGTLLFTGAGGTIILTGAMVGVDVGEGDTLYYVTTAEVSIPNPGDPGAPVAADGTPKATLTIGGADPNDAVIYTAVTSGTAGNAIRVAHVAGAGALSVAVAGNDITVTLASGGSTAAAVKAAVDALPAAAALVTTAVEGTGASLAVAQALTNLAGGANGVLPAGTYEWAYSFVTAAGETEIGPPSNALVLAINKQANISVVAAGGPGTIARKLYRRVDGGAWANVDSLNATFNNNVTTVGTDNDVALVGAPVLASTAERISVAAESEDTGEAYNAVVGAIRELVQVPDGVTDVTNTSTFIGGTDEEDMETFRSRLLDFIRNPRTGSAADLEGWAEAVDGVDTARAFANDNMGVVTAGHTTVRIAGPNGAVPSAGVVAAVLAELQAKDIQNIVIHVGTFTPVPTNVTVTPTMETGYVLADITASVQEAITDYINSVPVGATVYVAGLYDVIFGLPGIATLVVNTPAVDQTATATEKRTPGTIIVS